MAVSINWRFVLLVSLKSCNDTFHSGIGALRQAKDSAGPPVYLKDQTNLEIGANVSYPIITPIGYMDHQRFHGHLALMEFNLPQYGSTVNKWL